MVVDKKHGLIVSSEVASENNDLNQFHRQIRQASEVIGDKPKVVCSDSGYYSLEDLNQVEEDSMVVMPIQKQAQKENGNPPIKPFVKGQFRYDSSQGEYGCPGGKRFSYYSAKAREMTYKANGKDCRKCPHFCVCTSSRQGRRITSMREEPLKKRLEAISCLNENILFLKSIRAILRLLKSFHKI